MSDYFAPDGKPLSVEEWSALFERRRTAPDDSWWRRQSQVGDAQVSTVWLGLDHQFGEGPPLFWETMIFGGEHDEDCFRYSSKAKALADHDRLVAALEAGEDLS